MGGVNTVWDISAELRLIANSLDDAILAYDLDRNLIYANPAVEKLTCYSLAELHEHGFICWIHPEDQQRMLPLWDRVFAGESFACEYRMVARDGTTKWISASWGPVLDDTGRQSGVRGRERDITAQHDAQDQLAYQAHLLANVQDAIIATDLNFAVTFWNAAAERILGWRREEAIGRHIRDLVDFGGDERQLLLRRQLMEAGAWSGVRLVAVRGESYRWVDASLCAIRDAGGGIIGFSGIVRDVSDSKRMELALRENEGRSRAMIEALPDVLLRLSIDGTILDAHSPRPELLRLPAAQLLGLNLREILPLETAATAIRTFEDAIANRTVRIAEFRLSEPAEIAGDFEARVSPCSDEEVLVILRDVSAETAARTALRESEQRYRSVVESVREVIFQASVDGRWTFLNPAWEEITGIAVGESLGRNYLEFLHCEDREASLERFRALVSEENDECRHEVRILHRDGRPLWMDTSARVVKDAAGAVVGVSGTLADVTDRVQAAHELERAKAAAESAARVKSEFLTTMSHEVRTPLNGVIGMAELLLGSGLKPEHVMLAETIRHSGEMLLELVNDTLDYSKIEAGRMPLVSLPFDPGDVCRETVDLLAPAAARKDLELVLAVDPQFPQHVLGDAGRLRQILLNLAGNAVKFTERGEVQIRATVGERRPGGIVAVFEVEDTGIGIAPDARPLLFQPFTQADPHTTRRYGGSGLGLAISQKLTALLDGQIEVESELGRGSLFRVTIPFTLPPASGADGSPHRAADANLLTFRGRVLVAEDNVVNQRVASMMLEKLGLSVDLVTNGAEALRAASRTAYDAIFMDCLMPEMDGYEATRRIRRAESGRRHTLIIAMTANAFAEDRERCLAAGMDDYLAKPVTLASFRQAVNRWWDPRNSPTA